MSRFDEVYSKSLNDPQAFWAEAAEDVSWFQRWDKVLDDSDAPFYRWFTGAVCNTCYNGC